MRVARALLCFALLGVAGALLAPSGAAARSKADSCGASGLPNPPYTLDARAYYVSAGRDWRIVKFAFRLDGGEETRHNNVDLRVFSKTSSGSTRTYYGFDSPDSLVRDGRRYVVRPKRPVRVRKSARARVLFLATFDELRVFPPRSDPQCGVIIGL